MRPMIIICSALFCLAAATWTTPAQVDATAAPAAEQPDFKPEELDQMLASIALYPDSLLAQIFMASTYPIEVVEADRWVKANSSLKGDALAKELEKQNWDPSVRSLVNFPEVLTMMSENLSTTVKIGDAFIGQQKAVMDSVQRLRAKAQSTGNLNSTDQMKVNTTTQGGTQVIVIESSSPDVVYVPQYSPEVVYGGWPYPAYPPYPYYPPSYVASPVMAFGTGVLIGAAWGYAWGNCNWHGGDIDIDINRNYNRNTNIDRSKFQDRQRGSWRHDPGHRQGAAYRNRASAQRVGAGTTSARATQARSEYRGRAEAGRADIARGGADSVRGGQGARATQQSSRTSAGSGARDAGRAARSENAFQGMNRSGSQARQASSRGYSSRASSPSRSGGVSRSAGSRGGGGRGGGGGGRGGRR